MRVGRGLSAKVLKAVRGQGLLSWENGREGSTGDF